MTSSGALTLDATAGALSLNNDINAGGNDLTLSTSTASITFTSSPTLTAGTISLTQNGIFGQNAPATLAASDGLALTNTSTNSQPIRTSWMISGNRSFSLTSGGNITLTNFGDISTGTGDLTLDAQGSIAFNGTIGLTGGAITLNAAGGTIFSANEGLVRIVASGALTIESNINVGTSTLTLSTGAASITFNGSPTLTAATIELIQVGAFGAAAPLATFAADTVFLTNSGTADQAFYDWMTVGDYNISLASGGDITFAANSGFTKSTGAIIVVAGGLLEFGDSVSLDASSISLSQGGAFGATAPATLTTGALELINTSADAQAVQAWMVSVNRSLSLTSVGSITVGIDINTGTGNLTLNSQNTGNISFTGPRTLDGGDITLMTGASNIIAGGALTNHRNRRFDDQAQH